MKPGSLPDAQIDDPPFVHPGCPHGFDRAAPGADVVRRSRADRLRTLRGY